jgi:hypothetical protein
MSEQSYSVNSFCEAENISRAMLYKLWRLGQGPRFYMLGNVRRISHQARIEWQAAMEAAALVDLLVDFEITKRDSDGRPTEYQRKREGGVQ